MIGLSVLAALLVVSATCNIIQFGKYAKLNKIAMLYGHELAVWRKEYGQERSVHIQRSDYLWLIAMRCTTDISQGETEGDWWYFRFTAEELQKFRDLVVDSFDNKNTTVIVPSAVIRND